MARIGRKEQMNYRRWLADKDKRNLEIVARYEKILKTKNKSKRERPSHLWREYNISRERLYAILRQYGVTKRIQKNPHQFKSEDNK